MVEGKGERCRSGTGQGTERRFNIFGESGQEIKQNGRGKLAVVISVNTTTDKRGRMHSPLGVSSLVAMSRRKGAGGIGWRNLDAAPGPGQVTA